MRAIEQRNEAIWLRYEEHKSYKVIAEQLEIPLNTVKSWCRRYHVVNGLVISGQSHIGRPKEKLSQPTEKQSAADYEKHIAQLEMEVELLRDFLSVEERRSIKK